MKSSANQYRVQRRQNKYMIRVMQHKLLNVFQYIVSSKWSLIQKSIEVTYNFANNSVKCAASLHNILIKQEIGCSVVNNTFAQIMMYADSQKQTNFGALDGNKNMCEVQRVKDNFRPFFSSEELYDT